MRIPLTVFACVILALVAAPSLAQQCCRGNTDAAVTRQPPCELRNSGPMSKLDVEDASKLLTELQSARDARGEFYKISDSKKVYLIAGENYGCYGCGAQSYVSIGTLAEARDLINAVINKRIENASCKLRALGVDVPRP